MTNYLILDNIAFKLNLNSLDITNKKFIFNLGCINKYNNTKIQTIFQFNKSISAIFLHIINIRYATIFYINPFEL